MRTAVRLACAALLLAGTCPAGAVKLRMEMSPKTLAAEGFSMKTERDENGMLDFRLTRDPSKARWQGRFATLEIRGDRGLIARCGLEPDKRRGVVTYRFQLRPEQAAHSTLTISEVQTDPKNPEGLELIGGGTIYEFRLADWLETPSRR